MGAEVVEDGPVVVEHRLDVDQFQGPGPIAEDAVASREAVGPVEVGSSGAFEVVSSAFGATASLTVLAMLTYQNTADPGADAGANWYGQVKATQVLAKDAFDSINNSVAFAC